MVENQIMSTGAFELAKDYVRYQEYRYASLIRKANTTDNRIFLIECNNEDVKQENSNKNPTVNSVQRGLHGRGGQQGPDQEDAPSQDIVEADKEGIIHLPFRLRLFCPACTTATW